MELKGKEMEWKRQEVETCNLQFQLKLAHNFALKNFKLKYNFKIKFMTSTSNFHKSFCLILKMHCSFILSYQFTMIIFILEMNLVHLEFNKKINNKLLNFEGIANAFNISIELINDGFMLQFMI